MATPILSSSARVFGSMANVMEGSGSCAGSGFFQLGDGANVTGVEFADLRELFALHDLDVLKTLGKIAVVVEKGCIVFQNAAFHFEIVDAAGERIGKRLEDEEREWLAVVVFALDAGVFATGIF